ncbi:MAG: PTS sugar transporter subunit IIB [Deltaproteobacteria bacterium]|jgi:mannose/fructose/N-acetylgalactosamine-specific phosphotransferase system component IIB|nr:PTS sugar transporter subunit IIB [Deltaproteobacteria bacterium]
MPIVLARVDERLTHGQVMTSPALATLKINGIVIADGAVCQDPLTQAIYNASIQSADYDIKFGNHYTPPEDLLSFLRSVDREKRRFLVLFRDLSSVLLAIQKGVILSELNLGNFTSRHPEKKALTRGFQVGPTESEELKKLHWLIGFLYFNDLGSKGLPYSPLKHAWENV